MGGPESSRNGTDTEAERAEGAEAAWLVGAGLRKDGKARLTSPLDRVGSAPRARRIFRGPHNVLMAFKIRVKKRATFRLKKSVSIHKSRC